MSIALKTPQDVRGEVSARFKARRLSLNLSQEGLALRSGVSWGSLKRFEHKGLIAFEALLKLALVLDCLSDFDQLCRDREQNFAGKSLDAILAEPKRRSKGRIK